MKFGIVRVMMLTLAAGGLTSGTSNSQTPPKMKMTTPIPSSITTPDSVDTSLGTLKFFDGFPDDATVQKVYDNLDFERGVQAFLNGMPGASLVGMRTGFQKLGVINNNIFLFENRLDSKSLFLTGNTDSVYFSTWLNLKDGPMVLETPPKVLAFLDDSWFQYVTDIGNAGRDKGQGGKYLVLPPDYKVQCRRVTLSPGRARITCGSWAGDSR
jgi:hypothetical protein